jgi:hypothetical protein
MMLPDAEHVQTDLIGQLCLFDRLLNALLG